MSSADEAGVSARGDVLAKVFTGRLHVRYEKINQTFALCQASSGTEEHWLELRRLLRSLGDAAASFGVDELAAHATFIELRIEDMLGHDKHPHDVSEISQALAAMQSAH